ncbi:MAG: DUF2953 domain-containing protein [Alicyclobacillus sp.]|nr:DUF2953 domain-containing protein [Alicyclobacillus sp.]
MLVWIGILILFVGALMAATWLPVEIRVRLERAGGGEAGEVEVRYLFGAIRWKKRLPEILQRKPAGPEEDTGPHSAHKAKSRIWESVDVLRQFRHFRRLWYESLPNARWLLRRCEVHELRCRIRVGTGDVMTSGLAFGSTWAVVCGCLGPLTQLMRFRALPDVGVSCEFGRQVFDLALDCMMRVRSGYLIRAGLQLVRVWRRRTTHGTPHSRADADRHVGHPGNG